MASALAVESEDLLTCGVCLFEYDHEERKPKFLSCAHTACIKCLQLIWKDGYIVCPICRKKSHCNYGASGLANNLHALHMIELLKKHKQVVKKLLEPCWCLVCSKMADMSCLDTHFVIGIPSEKIAVGNDLKNIVEECKHNLLMAIKDRHGHVEELEALAASMKASEKEIRDQISANNCYIQEMDQSLASLKKPSQVIETCDSFIDRVKKMSKAIEMEYKQMTKENDLVKDITLFIQIEKNMKVIPTFSEFHNGFCKDTESPELKLLFHMVLSILIRRKIPLKPLASHPIAPFTTFIIQIHAKNEFFGKIHIKPSASFLDTFLKELRDFCFDQKQIFECSIPNVKSEIYAILDFQHDLFRPKEPEAWAGELASQSLDVGFGRYSSQDGRITGWELVFFAQDAHLKQLILLGKVVRGLDVVIALSNRNWSESETLKATWELA